MLKWIPLKVVEILPVEIFGEHFLAQNQDPMSRRHVGTNALLWEYPKVIPNIFCMTA